MGNKYQTHVTFRNKAAANRMAAAYRKQMGIGLDGLPRRYGRQKAVATEQAAAGGLVNAEREARGNEAFTVGEEGRPK